MVKATEFSHLAAPEGGNSPPAHPNGPAGNDRSETKTTGQTLREQFVAAGTLADQSWDDWKRDLAACAAKDGMGGIDPDDYRDFYDDGYEPSDAWHEDQIIGI